MAELSWIEAVLYVILLLIWLGLMIVGGIAMSGGFGLPPRPEPEPEPEPEPSRTDPHSWDCVTRWESRRLLNAECPDCGGGLLKGPEGGCSINVKCRDCGSKFNLVPHESVIEATHRLGRENPEPASA